MTLRERHPRRAVGACRRPLAARLLAVAGLLLGAGVAGVTTAAPSVASACPSSAGVTVVVDYGSLGGTSVGCATTPGSGIDVLRQTGHTVTYVPRQPGLVCTIDRRPDPCNGAPTTAYWSYWHAVPGGSWSYSTVGAASSHPKSGTVEGWAFGAGKPPAMRPPSHPRPPASSTTTRPAPRTTTSRPASRAATSPSGGGSTTSSSSTTRGSVTTTSPTSGPSATGTTSATTTGSASVAAGAGAPTPTGADAAAPTSATSPSSGTGTLVLAGVLVLLLAGGGGVIAWRRRGSGA